MSRATHALKFLGRLTVGCMLTIASEDFASALCDQTFSTRIGPPAMTQPNGAFQTITRDCTGVAGCSDYFDVALEAGDTLSLSLCSNGGSANFDANLSVWMDYDFQWLEYCSLEGCGGGGADVTFVAPDTTTYRVRVGADASPGMPVPDGNYTLAYSAPAGRLIVPASCGNGTLDAGEQCDDGNDLDGDCCSASCAFEPADWSCPDDGNDCSDERCDGAGTCLHPPTDAGIECADEGNDCTDNVCDGAGTCAHPNRPAGAYCYDGENFFCTADTCDGAGVCTHTEIPGCNMQPVCEAPVPRIPVTFPHPYKSPVKFEAYLVQALVSCNNPGGLVPNATTETGTVPSCWPAETHDDAAGNPSGGWHWGPYSYGKVQLYNRCSGAADIGIKFSMSRIVDENGALVNGDGSFLTVARLTLMDRVGGAMTTIDLPLSFGFHVTNGATAVLTSLNAMLTDQALPPLSPNGITLELGSVNPLDGGLIEVRDSNGTPFARPGVYLP